VSGLLLFGLWATIVISALRGANMVYELICKDTQPSERIGSVFAFSINLLSIWAVWQVIP